MSTSASIPRDRRGPGRPRNARFAHAYLAIGAGSIGAYFLLPAQSLSQTIMYSAIAVASVVALVVGTRTQLPPARRLPWYLFAAGLLAFAVGDSIFDAYDISGTIPFPSIADWIYLSAYPILFVGMVLLIRPFGPLGERFALLDATIVTAAFVVVQLVFLLEPTAHSYDKLLERAIAVAYPAMDILLVATLARLLFTRVALTPSLHLLTAGILTLLVADEIYYSQNVLYRWLDVFWLASYVCWGAAALHPSVARIAVGQKERDPRLSVLRFALLAAAVAAVPLVLVIQQERRASLHAYLLAAAAFAISALVLLRVAGLVRAVEELRRTERRARSDAEFATRLITEQNERLRELDRLKDEFVGMISHDLRTPLTSITGYVELLRDEETGPLNDEQRSFLEVVARNADRLLHLVSDLLLVARLETGRLELERDELDLADVAAQAVESAGPRAEAKGLTLSFARDGATRVLGEPGRLAQLLDNLVSNAIKFTPEGGRVSVLVSAANDAVLLEVSDSGIGIPDEERAHLFERFFRASGAVARQIPGTGLGLYISKAIAEAHDGTIHAESAAELGTTFRVTLPAATVREEARV